MSTFDHVAEPTAVADPDSSAPAEGDSTRGDSEPGRLASTAPRDQLPLWFERGLVVAVSGVIFFGGFGLLMAVLGHYSAPLVFSVGAVATLAASALAWPKRDRTAPRDGHRASNAVRLPAIGMCIVALAFLAWNGKDNGHYVSIDRDPGVYAAAGKWIATNGTLEVPAGTDWVTKGTEFNWASAGMYPEGNGRLEFQFNHLAPVLFAEGEDIGGDRLLFLMPALLGALGLCAIYAVGCRLVRRPWIALAAVTALAVSLPQISVARDTYSETSAQFLLWSGLWLLLMAYEKRRLGIALLAGLAVAGTMLSRVDALVYLIPLPLLGAAALLAVRTREDKRFLWRMYLMVLLGAVPMTVLGTIDVKYRSTGYYAALHSQISQLRVGFTVSVVGALLVLFIWPRLSGLQRWAQSHRAGLGITVAAVSVFGLLGAWALRPAHPVRAAGPAAATIAAAQKAEGLPLDPTRTYSEQSMVWLSWYLGAIGLALAIVGIAILIVRLFRRPEPAIALVLTVAGIGTALYIYTPQITPTQIWAMRRYVPAALPFLVLASAMAIDTGMALLPKLTLNRAWLRLVPAAAVTALIAFPLGSVIPVRSFQSQAGFISVVNRTCDVIGPNAAVLLVPDDRLRLTFPQTMRSYCGVEASQLYRAVSAADLKTVADEFKAEGKTLWVIGSTPALIDKSAPGQDPVFVGLAVNPLKLSETLTRPPATYTTEQLQIFVAKVAP